MHTIIRYIKPYKTKMIIGTSIKFIGAIMDLFIPYLLAHIIDNVVPLKDPKLIFLWGGGMILFSILAWATNVNANQRASRIAADATREIRHDTFSKISYLSSRQLDEFTVPSLVSRLTSDTYNIHRFLGMIQRMGVRAPFLLIGGIIITFTLEPVLTLIQVAILPVICVIVYFVSRKGIPMFNDLHRSVDGLVRIVQENCIGIRVIKALSKTDYEIGHFKDINEEVSDKDEHATAVMSITGPCMNFILNFGVTIILIVGAYRVNAGISQVGKLIAFQTYVTIILNAMLSVTRIFMMYSRASSSADRIGEVLAAKDGMPLGTPDRKETDSHIEFENVSFSYNKIRNNINDLSFSLKHGQTLGIIGATGSGKSTLIQLLLRFYDPQKGVIRINGEDIKGMAPEVLYTKFGIAFQNDILLADTIKENIVYGREGITDESIEKAIEAAQAKNFIDELEEGVMHELTIKGANISGGQKQRVLISRALAGDPEILILDDSSSALDYKTDAALRQAINRDFKDTTTIIVAQRISSIMNADDIIVLEQGNVVGHGRHEDLMRDCKEYADIYDLQMGG
ncbi:MAG: ABC transporter ATP-binding protein [Christensenellaceae bacterium]|nr:ABC transporter ATP-binding protein [Christensenellaceae bacterium]